MSRNGSGTQTTPNTFVAGTAITASDHNENWTDAAAEITNSVAADGQTTMTGPLKAASGTLAAPSQTFASDTDSGRYRKGSNTLADVVGGAEVVEISSTGINVTGAIKQNSLPLFPVGFGPAPWSGTTAPTGWLLCEGQSVLRADYPDLWTFAAAEIALSNTLWTNGNGTTTFTVPNMIGYVPAGVDASATRLSSAAAPGAAQGAKTKPILQTNLPNVNFTNSGITGGSTLNFTYFAGGGTPPGGVGAIVTTSSTTGSLSIAGSVSGLTQGSAASGGSGTELAIVQPTIAVKYIVKY